MTLSKILRQDLGVELENLLKEIERARGVYNSLPERLDSADDNINKLDGEMDWGNFNEVYHYDKYGNVIKQEVTGDKNFTVNYIYADPESGILNYSEKVFAHNNEEITVRKTYTYDEEGNITQVETTTIVEEIPEEEGQEA